MPIPKSVRLGHKALRSVVGENSRIEKLLKRKYLRRTRSSIVSESGSGWAQKAGSSFMLIGDNDRFEEPRRGIVLRGGCDMPSTFTAAPLIRKGIKGSIVISRDRTGGAGAHSTRQILQTLNDIPREATDELRTRLQISAAQFEQTFFAKTVEHPLMEQYGQFPRNVVVMSAATDFVRVMYEHREHGYVVDPGGWWLNQDLGEVLGDLDNVQWFRKNFKKVGRISVEDFARNIETIFHELRTRSGADLIIYSSLVVEPSDPTHNYQLLKEANVTRRREFHIALMELSRKLDFHLVDVDRVLKREGISEQVDFAHFPAKGMEPIGAEFYKILKELEIV